MTTERDATIRVSFCLRDTPVRVGVPTAELARLVENLYPGYVVHAGEGDVACVIRETSGGWEVCADHEANHFPDLGGALTALEHTITLSLLQGARAVPQLHAAGAVVHGRAILAVGGPGAGKSSIALALCTRGSPALGDDVILLTERGDAAPFKRHFTIHPDRLRELKVPPNPNLDWLADDEDAWFDPRTAAGWADDAPIDAIVHVRHTPGADPPERHELTQAQVLHLLLASGLRTGPRAHQYIDLLVPVARRAVGFELRFADAAHAADRIVQWM
jgi:hypothetical protein